MKVVWGSLIVDGRGKIGGHVASKNRGGAYMRTKVSPSNPRTTAQLAIRNGLSTFSQGWKALTAAQRNAWSGAVESFAKTDVFGSLKSPSGINLYIKLNQNLTEAAQTPLVLPPLPAGVDSPETITVTGAAGTPALSLSYTGATAPSGLTWLISGTPQISPGKSYVKNLFRTFSVVAAPASSPVNILAAYTARFGTLVAGMKVVVQVVVVNNATGQKSLPVQSVVIIAA